jgi:hypothetical protein
MIPVTVPKTIRLLGGYEPIAAVRAAARHELHGTRPHQSGRPIVMQRPAMMVDLSGAMTMPRNLYPDTTL